MSAIQALISMGLTLQADGDRIIVSGLNSCTAGEAEYALRLAKAKKDEIVQELLSSSKALEELLNIMHHTPGITLFFHSLKPVPTFSLQINEQTQPNSVVVLKANSLFLKATDAIHFNAEKLARDLRPSMFEWPVSATHKRATAQMIHCYKRAKQWIEPHRQDLINAGWNHAQLYGTSKMHPPFGWGIAWSPLWGSASAPFLTLEGFIEWKIQTTNGVSIQTMRPK